METPKRNDCISGQVGPEESRNCTAAVSQSRYNLRSQSLLKMESESQNSVPNSIPLLKMESESPKDRGTIRKFHKRWVDKVRREGGTQLDDGRINCRYCNVVFSRGRFLNHIAGHRFSYRRFHCPHAPFHARQMAIIGVETRPARGKFQPDYRDLFGAIEWYEDSPYAQLNAIPRSFEEGLAELSQDIRALSHTVVAAFNANAARVANKRKRDGESTHPPETAGNK